MAYRMSVEFIAPEVEKFLGSLDLVFPDRVVSTILFVVIQSLVIGWSVAVVRRKMLKA